jgi:hypothetical protein
LRADCIRVTHPYDTLGSVLLPNLPFVLHVLGLPLAFILSQDQTLHSINLHSLKLQAISFKLSSAPPSCNSSFLKSATGRLCHLILGLIVLVRVWFHITASPNTIFKESTRNTPLSRYLGSAIISIHSKNVFRFPKPLRVSGSELKSFNLSAHFH